MSGRGSKNCLNSLPQRLTHEMATDTDPRGLTRTELFCIQRKSALLKTLILRTASMKVLRLVILSYLTNLDQSDRATSSVAFLSNSKFHEEYIWNISGPGKEKVMGDWRTLHTEELCNSIIRVIRLCTHGGNEKCIQKIFV
jgi:hypothetical protein